MVAKARDPFLWLAPHLAGDDAAYREYSERLVRDLKCYFAGNGCQQPDDLVSEVMFRLVRKLNEGEPEGRDTEAERRQYVFGIAKFVLKEWRRGPAHREQGLPDEEIPGLRFAPLDLAHVQCLELLAQEVRKHLAQLSPAEQEILSSSELNPDFTPKLAELARQKGTLPATFRQQAFRARQSFKKLLMMSDRLADLFRCLGMEPVDA